MENSNSDGKDNKMEISTKKRKLTYWQSREIFLRETNMKKRCIDENIATDKKLISMILLLVLSSMFDILFVNKSYGISSLIFVLLFLSIFLYINKNSINIKVNLGWFLILASILLSSRYALFSNNILNTLNVIVIPILLILGLIIIRYNNNSNLLSQLTTAFFQQILPRSFENIFKPFNFLGQFIKRKEETSETKRNIIKGIIISIPLIFVLILLLSSADKMFNYFIINAFKFNNLNFSETLGHLLLVLVLFFYFFGFMWSFNYPFEIFSYNKKNKTELDGTIIITLLVLINILYAIFCAIQTKYLYGNNDKILPDGLSYAQYAREGFFQLVTVTIINLLIILIITKMGKYHHDKAIKLSKVLMNIILLFTLIMLYASHYKLSLYEDAYGFTFLRFFVHYTILAIFILIILFSIGIWRPKINLMKYSIVLLIVMYLFINFFNADKFIANKNFDRYEKINKIDASYITHLTPDAFSYIYTNKNTYSSNLDIKNNIDYYIDKNIDYSKEGSHWYEFNYNKHIIKKTVQ